MTRREAGPVRRHLRWAIPLIAAPLLYVGGLTASFRLAASSNAGVVLLAAVVGLTMVALTATSLILALVGGIRTAVEWHRRRRRSRGRFTPAEQQEIAAREREARSWEAAAQAAARLATGQPLIPITSSDLVPAPDEILLHDGVAHYARYYGQTVTYTTTSGAFVGSPSFVLAGLAGTMIGNSAARSRAHAAAREQWREHQTCRLVVSNQRLMCLVGGRWLSFWYGAIVAIYPEVDQWTLICQFDSAEPLMLHGADAPMAAVVATAATRGSGSLRGHPSLQPLFQPSTAGAALTAN